MQCDVRSCATDTSFYTEDENRVRGKKMLTLFSLNRLSQPNLKGKKKKKKERKKEQKTTPFEAQKKDSTGYGCHEPDPDSRCTMLHDSTSDISLVESPREKTGYAAKSTSRFSVRSLTTLAFSVLSFVLASNKLILPPSQLLLMWHCVHT